MDFLSIKGASLGTLGVSLTKDAKPFLQDFSLPCLTTPDALNLHKLAQTLFLNNIHHCIMEASSHGLDQYRLHSIQIKAAGFTNLTQDHLDYHTSMESYFNAKARLFTELLAPDATAVLNADSPYFTPLELLVKSKGNSILSYSLKKESALKATSIRLTPGSTQFNLSYNGIIWPDIQVNVVGLFQIENILCAIGLLIATGVSIETLIPFLHHLKSASGRLEFVGETVTKARVFIDYAHTPDALYRLLTALKAHVKQGKIHLVFGCGGNRDTQKRAIMGKIAHTHADVIYVTDDNPRYEEPAFIRAQILTGCPQGIEIGDRENAISQAIANLEPNDTLLIVGKGHEQGQLIGDNSFPFDDKNVAQRLLKHTRV